tara:strand:+ start:445 stop:1056 length:612 start_codon:yes stop_codon:yes gene_type:complete
MVKLYSDEEMLEKCKLYHPIPLAMEQKILHYEGNPNNINILNGIIKSPYKTGQPVDSIINYAYQLGQDLPVSAEAFISAYEKALDKEIKKGTKQVMDELLERIEMEGEDGDYVGMLDPRLFRASSQDELNEIATEMGERFEMEMEEIESQVGTASTAALPEVGSEQDLRGMKTRRKKIEMTEARTMGEEDEYPGGKVSGGKAV